ncbi:mersacidin/lichenicidin family type 2 lantibiotic [Dictyobacter kobayashii]|uniref:Mersacidin/lichenicidin family type 2 lantibiotic n=1 Tax=Dictyobacter kobayashii TaxID=2014872 RepID=A0A402ASX6_9CHLR|nr:mersacidin/lichenicidin family type 2 lantibiotic [Dictyobacter kobayashii]GCE22204.1 hypothetical protein KDK_60040 [Dictyobacter kobayashii]
MAKEPNYEKIFKAWKDPAFRASLSPEEQGELPETPAGFLDLSEEEQDGLVGGTTVVIVCTTVPSLCARGTLCGTCAVFTSGCC